MDPILTIMQVAALSTAGMCHALLGAIPRFPATPNVNATANVNADRQSI